MTEQGLAFYWQAERTLDSHEALGRFAAQIRRSRSNHVSILTAPYVTETLIGNALATMARESPTFSATLQTRIRRDMEQWVGDETFDLALTVLPLLHPAFETEAFLRIDAVAMMHKDHPLARHAVIETDHLFDIELIVAHSESIIRQRRRRIIQDCGRRADCSFRDNEWIGRMPVGGAWPGRHDCRSFCGAVRQPREPGDPAFSSGRAIVLWPRIPIRQPRSETVQRLAVLIKDNAAEQARRIAEQLASPS